MKPYHHPSISETPTTVSEFSCLSTLSVTTLPTYLGVRAKWHWFVPKFRCSLKRLLSPFSHFPPPFWECWLLSHTHTHTYAVCLWGHSQSNTNLFRCLKTFCSLPLKFFFLLRCSICFSLELVLRLLRSSLLWLSCVCLTFKAPCIRLATRKSIKADRG